MTCLIYGELDMAGGYSNSRKRGRGDITGERKKSGVGREDDKVRLG